MGDFCEYSKFSCYKNKNYIKLTVCQGLRGPKGKKGEQGLPGNPGAQGESGPQLQEFGDMYREFESGSVTGAFGAEIGLQIYPIKLSDNNIIPLGSTTITHATDSEDIGLSAGNYLISYSVTIGVTDDMLDDLIPFALLLNDAIIPGSEQAEFFSVGTIPGRSRTIAANISATVIVTVETDESILNLVVLEPETDTDPNTQFIVRAATVTIVRLGD